MVVIHGPVPVAVSALYGNRLDVSRGLRSGQVFGAPRERSNLVPGLADSNAFDSLSYGQHRYSD